MKVVHWPRRPLRHGLFLYVTLLAGVGAAGALPSQANVLPDGLEIMHRVNLRARERASRARQEITIRDAKRGDFHKTILVERRRFAPAYRTIYRIAAPAHESGMALLISEDASPPGMWMYFPLADQVVPIATRGFPALATDFACEDLLASVPLSDYDFRTLGPVADEGGPALQIEMTPRTERLRSELGFARALGWVRRDIWMIVRAEYYDEKGVLFKGYRTADIERVQGIWTARTLSMENYRAQHRTEVRVVDVDYSAYCPKELFVPNRMGAGGTCPPR